MSAGHFLRAALGEDVLKEKNVNKLVAEVGFFIIAAYAAYAESTKQPERRKHTTATRAAAVQAGQLYFVNLVRSTAAYAGEVRF